MDTDKFLSFFESDKPFIFAVKKGGKFLHKPGKRGPDIEEWLRKQNENGGECFFTVNELDQSLDTDPKSHRTAKMLTRIRAVWVDDDEKRKEVRTNWPIEPSLVVNTSPGKYHYYWLIKEPLPSTGKSKTEWRGVMETLVNDWGGDNNTKDLTRILRLPGFNHLKDPTNPHLVTATGEGQRHTWDAIREAFPPSRGVTREKGASVGGVSDSKTIADLIRDYKDGHRHGPSSRIAMKLANHNVPKDDIISMLVEICPDNLDHHTQSVTSAIDKIADEKKGENEEVMNPISGRELLNLKFGDLHWNIDNILPAGTVLLFGKPKKGKSFLALLIAISIASGQPVFGHKTSRRHVLYLGLEDSFRRLKNRFLSCANSLGINSKEFVDRFYLDTKSARIDTGLLDELHDWMKAHPDTGVIVLDMLKKITASKSSGKDLYAEQAKVGDALTAFCHDYPQLSIIVVHHSRKADSDDPFDLVSGTTGLSGSYDSLATITESEGTRSIHMTGRDIEGAEIPLLMNDRGMYTLAMPDPDEQAATKMSKSRRLVYEAVPVGEGVGRKEIIEATQLSDNVVDQHLRHLKRDELIKRVDQGKYQRANKRWFDEPVVDLGALIQNSS